MKRNSSPWTFAEKSLFLLPVLLAGGAAIYWGWLQSTAEWIPFAEATSQSAVVFSPDSQQLLVTGKEKTSRVKVGTVKIPVAKNSTAKPGFKPIYKDILTVGAVFDAESRERLSELESPLAANPQRQFGNWPSWSPQGNSIASCYYDSSSRLRHIVLWDALTGLIITRPLYTPKPVDGSATVEFSRDGTMLVGAGRPPAVFDVASGTPLSRFTSSFQAGEFGAFNPDQTLVSILGDKGSLFKAHDFQVRDVQTKKVLWEPDIQFAQSFIWGANNILGVNDSIDPFPPPQSTTVPKGHLLLWDGKTRRVLPSPASQAVAGFALNAKAPVVAVAEIEWKVGAASPPEIQRSDFFVWDIKTQRELWKKETKGYPGLLWSPDGRWLCVKENVPGADRITLFDADGQTIRELERKTIYQIQWSPDSKKLAIVEKGGVEMVRVLAGKL